MKQILKLPNIFFSFILIFIFAVFLAKTAWASNETPTLAINASTTQAKKNQRNYPHGQDEEDLKVQTELKRPEAHLDEKSIQARVLKNFLKKTGEDTPGESESSDKGQ